MSGPEWLETRLWAVSEGLRELTGSMVTPETCQGLIEALRAAAGPHQQYTDADCDDVEGDPGWCGLDGEEWPCQTVRDVTEILEGLW